MLLLRYWPVSQKYAKDKVNHNATPIVDGATFNTKNTWFGLRTPVNIQKNDCYKYWKSDEMLFPLLMISLVVLDVLDHLDVSVLG